MTTSQCVSMGTSATDEDYVTRRYAVDFELPLRNNVRTAQLCGESDEEDTDCWFAKLHRRVDIHRSTIMTRIPGQAGVIYF